MINKEYKYKIKIREEKDNKVSYRNMIITTEYLIDDKSKQYIELELENLELFSSGLIDNGIKVTIESYELLK